MTSKLHDFFSFLESGTNLSEWASFAMILLAGGVVGIIADFIIRTPLKQIVKKIKWLPTEGIIQSIRFLCFSVFGICFFHRGLDVFQRMPGWLWQWKTDIIPWLYGFCFFIFTIKIVDVIVETLRLRWSETNAEMDESVALFLGRAIKFIIVLLILLLVLDNLGVKVLGLITGLGFLGATIALASQATVANAIGYFEILFDRLFKVNDLIAFGNFEGFVNKRGLRNVEIRSLTGEKINVPNKELVDKQIRNYTRHHHHRISIQLELTYDANRSTIEKSVEILKDIFSKMSQVNQHEIVFRKLGNSSLEFEVIFWAAFRTQSEYNDILTEAHLSIKERFDKAKIEFAYPTQTLYVKKKNPLTAELA